MTNSTLLAADGPEWLVVGLRALDLKSNGDANRRAAVIAELGVDARTLQASAQLVKFMQTHYPERLAVPAELGRVKPSVLLEFTRLHTRSKEVANQIADRCFSGNAKVAEVKSLLAMAGNATSKDANARNRVALAFSQTARRHIEQNPSALKPFIPSGTFRAVKERNPLNPDYEVTDLNRKYAVELKHFAVGAMRSVTTQAASLIERVATLRLHYDDVVVIMPTDQAAHAHEVLKMMRAWVRDTRPTVHTVPILLIGDNISYWV